MKISIKLISLALMAVSFSSFTIAGSQFNPADTIKSGQATAKHPISQPMHQVLLTNSKTSNSAIKQYVASHYPNAPKKFKIVSINNKLYVVSKKGHKFGTIPRNVVVKSVGEVPDIGAYKPF